jgi:hypothetical protein
MSCSAAWWVKKYQAEPPGKSRNDGRMEYWNIGDRERTGLNYI